MRAIFELFLIPAGRIGRVKFGFGLAGFIGFIYGMNGLMRAATPQSAFEFWLGLTYVFLFFYMLYCIYGKRLHDMGRTFWPLTACITLSFLIMSRRVFIVLSTAPAIPTAN